MSVPRLRAPKDHGQLLAVPPLDQAAALLGHNQHLLTSTSIPSLGRSLVEIRTLARREILALSTAYHREAGEPSGPPLPMGEGLGVRAEAPSTVSKSGMVPPSPPAPLPEGEGRDAWFVAGHQPELFHPGVWIKNFALDRLARRHQATALNLVIDTDAAKPAILHVPAGDHVARVPFDRSTQETPYEERIVEDEATFASLPERVAQYAALWDFEPMLAECWQAALAQSKRTPLLGERFAAARRAMERRWGMTPREVPMSWVCGTEAFALFLTAILGDLPRFHAIYNETVREHRVVHQIRNRSHPVPDLATDGDWLEAPFWAWRSGSSRRGRLFARRNGGSLQLRVGQEIVDAPVRDLVRQGIKVRPRALTTTMFTRLFLADVFLHGIGGGIYDALTDRIIERFLGISAPGFLIVSATLLLPLPRFPEAESRRRALLQQGRDLIYKPELFVAVDETTEPWLQAKREWIAKDGATHAERVARFRQLRAINAELFRHVESLLPAVQAELAECEEQIKGHAVASRRDYAFCLYPEAMLREAFTSDSGLLPF